MSARTRKSTSPENASSDSTILEKIKEFGENVLDAVTKPFRHAPARKTSRKSGGRKAPAKKAATAGKPVKKKGAPARKAAPAKKKAPAKKTGPARKAAKKRG